MSDRLTFRLDHGSSKSTRPWPTAAKNGFGTSTTLASKVWFTLANGVLTEVFYPTVDTPKVKTLQLTVSTAAGVETRVNTRFIDWKCRIPHR